MQRKRAYTTNKTRLPETWTQHTKKTELLIAEEKTDEFDINIGVHRKRINTQKSNQPAHEQDSRNDTRANELKKEGTVQHGIADVLQNVQFKRIPFYMEVK